jgi:hypothetical protein
MCDIIVQYELLKYINVYLNYASLLIKVQVVPCKLCLRVCSLMFVSQNMRHLMAVYAREPSYMCTVSLYYLPLLPLP